MWIAIAVIAVLIVAALVVGLVRYRRSRISLPPGRDETTAVDRSGGYTASSGITFSDLYDAYATSNVYNVLAVAWPDGSHQINRIAAMSLNGALNTVSTLFTVVG